MKVIKGIVSIIISVVALFLIVGLFATACDNTEKGVAEVIFRDESNNGVMLFFDGRQYEAIDEELFKDTKLGQMIEVRWIKGELKGEYSTRTYKKPVRVPNYDIDETNLIDVQTKLIK